MKKRKIQQSEVLSDGEQINPLQLFMGCERSTNSHHKKNQIVSNQDVKSNININAATYSDNIVELSYGKLTARSNTEESSYQDSPQVQNSNISFQGCSINLDLQRKSSKSNTFQCKLPAIRRKRQRGSQLKDIVHRQKVSNIVRTFAQKLKRNNIQNEYSDEDLFHEQKTPLLFEQINGIELNNHFQRIFQLVTLILHFVLIYYYTLNLTFTLSEYSWSASIQQVGLALFFIDFCFNISTVKIVSGKRISSIREIAIHYFNDQMIFDALFIIVLLVSLANQDPIIQYFKLIILTKIPYCLQKMEKLQIILISNTYKQQYWSIAKVFLFNFCFAHFLAIILKFMSNIDPQNNWLTLKAIDNVPWYQIYVWAYYWAVNIMLTVGFGDFYATTYQEAMCLIFIETFSCIALAYNINCVGNLISNIRAQDLQKSKKYKIFRSLARKNDISSQLFLRIGNYIQQSNNIKKKFNIEEENKFVDGLPKIFKKDFLNQSNKSIFHNIYFFRNLADKAIQSLAQSIQINITHPEERIMTLQNFLSLKILKEGTIGYCVRKTGCEYNGLVIDQVTVQAGQKPFLMGLQFIINKRPNYQIKSLSYSVNYNLNYDKLISSMRKSRGDYQYFCLLRDKNKHIIDEFQIFHCSSCKTNHTRFNCPFLHYIPIHQHIIYKSLHRQKIDKSRRIGMQRLSLTNFNALGNFKYLNSESPNSRQSIASTFKKNKVYIIKELFTNIERYDTELTHGLGSYVDLQLHFLANAAESMKQELSNFLRRQNQEDEVWIINLDIMQNYKCYFPDDNPCNLHNKFKELQAEFIVQNSCQIFHQLKTQMKPKKPYQKSACYNTEEDKILQEDDKQCKSINSSNPVLFQDRTLE